MPVWAKNGDRRVDVWMGVALAAIITITTSSASANYTEPLAEYFML
jgi:hypothetical protein